MSANQENKALVRRFLKAVEGGDIAVIEQLQSADCRWWILGRGWISKDSYVEGIRTMLLAADPRTIEITGIIAEDGVVAAEIRSSFGFGERVYENAYHDIFVIRDGVIVEGKEYFDTGKVAAFFGDLSK